MCVNSSGVWRIILDEICCCTPPTLTPATIVDAARMAAATFWPLLALTTTERALRGEKVEGGGSDLRVKKNDLDAKVQIQPTAYCHALNSIQADDVLH
jgi:hypothetical protein